jgi:hypothetical protein
MTMRSGESSMLTDLFMRLTNDDAAPVPRDMEGTKAHRPHDPRNFKTMLNFLRANTATVLPEMGTRE